MQVTRTVPKFLQKHIHLLGRKTEPNPDDDDEDEAQLTAEEVNPQPSTVDDSDDEDQRVWLLTTLGAFHKLE